MTRGQYMEARREDGVNRFFLVDFMRKHRPQRAARTRAFHRALNYLWALRLVGIDAATERWWINHAVEVRQPEYWS